MAMPVQTKAALRRVATGRTTAAASVGRSQRAPAHSPTGQHHKELRVFRVRQALLHAARPIIHPELLSLDWRLTDLLTADGDSSQAPPAAGAPPNQRRGRRDDQLRRLFR